MSGWSAGYVADTPYTAGFYREVTPAWLAFAAVLLGHRPPDLSRPFRWAELGCGQGFSATIAAACHPEAGFWGFDFNPSHIDRATALARRAGLANLRFQEASFAELAALPDGALPAFDFIVLHGIWSWVVPAEQAHLAAFIRRRLAPGGLALVSYNAEAGWGAMAPLQRLMRRLASGRTGPSHEAIAPTLAFLRRLAATDALLFQRHPMLGSWLAGLSAHDPHYLAHEYLNEGWRPCGFDEVSAALADARCGFIGSATLLDNIDAVAVPPAAGRLIGEAGDVVLRELLRDVAAARSFRRDLYRRGTDQPLSGEHAELLDALTITGTGREREPHIEIATGIGHTTPKMELYQPVLDRLAAGPLGMSELRTMPHLSADARAEALQIMTFLVAGGIAHPSLAGNPGPAALRSAASLNREIARDTLHGGSARFLAAPRIASGFQIDPVESLLLDRLSGQGPPDIEALTSDVLAALARGGRSVQRDGVVQREPDAARAAMRETVARIASERLPLLRRMGIVA